MSGREYHIEPATGPGVVADNETILDELSSLPPGRYVVTIEDDVEPVIGDAVWPYEVKRAARVRGR